MRCQTQTDLRAVFVVFIEVMCHVSDCLLLPVALNYQTDDRQNLLNRALFTGNGGCGYQLKPRYLREPGCGFSPCRSGLFPAVLGTNYWCNNKWN